MGTSTSCNYFSFGEEKIVEPNLQVITDENVGSNVSPGKITEFATPRPVQESSKTLRNKDDRRGADDRWKKAKAEWQATVMADLEEKERLQQAPSDGHEPDRYGSDERRQALEAIREEEDERQRALKERSPDSDVENPAQVEEGLPKPPTPCQADVQNHQPTHELGEVREGEQPLVESEERSPKEKDEKEEGSLQEVRLPEEAVGSKAQLDDFLAKNGFDGVSNKRRRTLQPSIYALHLAAERGDATLVTLLVEAGADASQKDSSGRTPADVAKKKNRKGSHDEVVALLSR